MSKIRFLLIQDGVVDVAKSPETLAFNFVDAFSGFKVAIGCVNEFGENEIVGIVAEALPVSKHNVWAISSYHDGYRRIIGAAGSPACLIQTRLIALYRSNLFSDLCQLPARITIEPGKPQALKA